MGEKKILMLNYEYPPLGGGGGVAAKTLAEAFAQKGYHVDFVTTHFKGLKKEEQINGVLIHRVPVWGRKNRANASMISLLTFPVCAYRKGVQLCKQNEYAFINTHFAVPTGPLGVWISGKFKIPNILCLHGGDIYDPTKKFSPHKWRILRACIKYVLNHSDHVIAQSADTKKNAEKYYPAKKKIRIIPLPYQEAAFDVVSREDLGLRESDIYLISIGRLVRIKGYDYLLHALAQMERPDLKLIILGEGPEWENLQRIIKEKGLEDRVVMPGAVFGKTKYQYLSCADIYVLSSVHESFGIVLQEAMQAGLPIVSTNNGGQNDLIKENENGVLVEPCSAAALRGGVSRLLDNRELMDQMKQNNVRKVKEFAADVIAGAYIACIKDGK